MKYFLKRVLEFTVLMVLLAVLSDLGVSNGLRKTERGHFYTMNALMNKQMDADIVILGNSFCNLAVRDLTEVVSVRGSSLIALQIQ